MRFEPEVDIFERFNAVARSDIILMIKLIGAVVVWKIPVNLSSLLRRELCTGWTNSAIQVTRNCISIHQLWSGQGDGMTVGANGGVLYNGRSQFVKDGIVRDRR